IRLTSGDLFTGPVKCIAVSPDGTQVLAGCADHIVRIVDVKKAKVIRSLNGNKNAISTVSYSTDEKHVYSGSFADYTIIEWDVITGNQVRHFHAKEVVSSLAIGPTGDKFLAPEFDVIQEWNLKTGERLRQFKGHKYRIYAVFYSPDGKTIVSGGA